MPFVHWATALGSVVVHAMQFGPQKFGSVSLSHSAFVPHWWWPAVHNTLQPFWQLAEPFAAGDGHEVAQFVQ